MDPFVRKNQELWDEWAEINYRSAFYDVAGFLRSPPPLDEVVLDALGDLTGKRVLHLQCHFGMDTLRLAQRAASATGIDFSSKAIARANELAAAANMTSRVRFIESDLYALPGVLDEQFDVVFTSLGVIGWLPDLARWGQIIARYLVPGGRFVIVEGHPTMMIFDNESETLAVRYPYFLGDEPIAIPPKTGNYADATAVVTKTEYSWPHSLAEVVTSLLDAGLRLDELREYPFTYWKAFPFLLEQGERFVMPPDRPSIPLTFSIRASKP
jgi:ubiquinone/menaquinone biosynthesis C-methylase UbiE